MEDGNVGIRSPEGGRTRNRSLEQVGKQAGEGSEEECTGAMPGIGGWTQNWPCTGAGTVSRPGWDSRGYS